MRDEKFIKNIETTKIYEKETKRIILVGQPNVGKSVIFNALTGNYVNVSNYPGTTVEVTKGKMKTDFDNSVFCSETYLISWESALLSFRVVDVIIGILKAFLNGLK